MTNRGEVFNSDGKNILQVLQSSEIYLPASCGGKGICGRCKIRIIDGKVKSRSFLGISEEERKQGYVLACKSYPESDVLIELPQKLITVSERISIARIELIEQVFKEAPSLLDPLLKKVNLNLSPPPSKTHGQILKDYSMHWAGEYQSQDHWLQKSLIFQREKLAGIYCYLRKFKGIF